MEVYLVDRDLPGITGEGLAMLQRTEIGASQQFTAAGQAVRYVACLLLARRAVYACSRPRMRRPWRQ
jgi:hypothetical protein